MNKEELKDKTGKFFLKSKIVILNSIYSLMLVAQDNISFIKDNFKAEHFLIISIAVALLNVYFRFGSNEKIYLKKDKEDGSNK